MKAINLEQVVRFFDPKEPLSGQHLQMWFVQRPQSPRRQMRTYLMVQRPMPMKLLLVGHRGSGKSTELNKLIEELGDAYAAIGFNVLDLTGRTTPGYEDLMLVLATQITRYCIANNLIPRPAGDVLSEQWRSMSDWWRRLVAGVSVQPASVEVNTYVELSTLLGQIELGARQSSQTREAVIDQVNRHMPELIRQLNLVIDEAHRHLDSKRLLIIVEGLDKVDLESANSIFRGHAPTITALNAAMIYTFPLALRHSDEYATVRRHFDGDHFLHNFALRHADGNEDGDGMRTLSELVLKRLEPALIDDDALRLLVDASGGFPVDLVKLVRNAAIYALDHPETSKICASDADEAIKDLRREISAPLTRADWQVLKKRHEDRVLTNDEENRRLLFNGALIEYSNHRQWCDAHPVLWAILDYYAEE